MSTNDPNAYPSLRAAELSPQLLDETRTEAVANGGPYPIGQNESNYDASETVLGYDDAATDRAVRYAQALFANDQLTVLSSEGSSAVILHDDAGRVYKVFRRSDRYDYTEEEAAKCRVFADLGLSPTPIMLVDAAPAYRTQRSGERSRPFGDVIIPRTESTGLFPVLVMEEVKHAMPLQNAGPEVALREFQRVVALAAGRNFIFEDVEFVYDTDKNQMVMLDVGGVSLPDQDDIAVRMAKFDGYQGLDFEQAAHLTSLTSLASRIASEFGKKPFRAEVIRQVLDASGPDGLSAYLFQTITNQ